MRKYIFCINTGRSGSDYLSKLIDNIPEICSTHEPQPIMNTTPMYEYLHGNKSLINGLMHNKVESIRHLKKDSKVYLETNHCFIKGFGWEIVNYIPKHEIGVIVLKRDHESIIDSYLRIGSNPFSNAGPNWLITPNNDAITKPPISKNTYWFLRQVLKPYFYFSRKTPFFLQSLSRKLLQWYIDETHALYKKFRVMHPEIKFYEISISQLNSHHEIDKMLRFFEIEIMNLESYISTSIGKKTNLKSH